MKRNKRINWYKIKNFIIRLLYIIGLPCSILSLYIGFYRFIFNEEVFAILPIVLGMAYWVMLSIKYPKKPIRRRW